MQVVVNKSGEKWRVQLLMNFNKQDESKVKYLMNNFTGMYDTEEEANFNQKMAHIFITTGVDGRVIK